MRGITGLKAGVNGSAADSPCCRPARNGHSLRQSLSSLVLRHSFELRHASSAFPLSREARFDFPPGLRKLRSAKGMQHVTAFSPPQTVPAAPAAGRKPNLWILDGWRDLILYVCTPLVILPIFIVAQTRWSAEDIYLFIAAFGAMGHHLPGMIRAYGDRALFQRFKWRFIFAPIFLVVVCTAFFLWDLKGIVLVAFIWGVWHGMMQTYGFCRIYDAKVGSFAALTRRLDFALCGIWLQPRSFSPRSE